MTAITIHNPSASHPLRISAQTRRQTPIDDTAPTPRPPAKSRAELEVLAAEPVRVALDGLAAGREITQPRWEAEGAAALVAWVTRELEKGGRAGEPAAPPGVRVSDDWSEPQLHDTLPPHAKVTLDLEDSRRYVLQLDKEPGAVVQITNPSTVHTLGLRILERNGRVSNAGFLAPGQSGALSVGSQSGIIEQRPV